MKNLTPSQSHYIRAVYELSSDCDDGVRVCDVAKKLSVSKASASLALSKLAEQGFLYKDADRHGHLTESGERKAVLLLDKFDVIRTFLVKTLGVEKSVAAHDACAIEHVISTDTLCAICHFSNRTRCTNSCSLSCNPDP
ncbi:MAG: metal-dependent transcriptional regulator [Christensenellales bacterium]|jgi:DtxR family Mn-dependent transcriptional regulator